LQKPVRLAWTVDSAQSNRDCNINNNVILGFLELASVTFYFEMLCIISNYHVIVNVNNCNYSIKLQLSYTFKLSTYVRPADITTQGKRKLPLNTFSLFD
jgi:hypothetical protein